MSEIGRAALVLRTDDAQFRRGLRGAGRDVQGLGQTVNRLKTIFAGLAAAFTVRQLVRGVGSLLKAWQGQEDAVQSLRASLAATGKEGAENLQFLIDRAGELQEVTRHGDEALIAATGTLALLAEQLRTQDLADAQRAIIGIADVFLKGDVENAAQLLGKTLGSTTNALTRYGIVIDTSATQSEKLRQVLAKTEGMFAVSQERAKTLSGQLEQLNNLWGDLKEELGKVIAEQPVVTEFLGQLKQLIRDIITTLRAETPNLSALFHELGVLMGAAFARGFLTVIDSLLDVIIRNLPALPIAFLDVFVTMFEGLQMVIEPLIERIDESLREALANIHELAVRAGAVQTPAPTDTGGEEGISTGGGVFGGVGMWNRAARALALMGSAADEAESSMKDVAGTFRTSLGSAITHLALNMRRLEDVVRSLIQTLFETTFRVGLEAILPFQSGGLVPGPIGAPRLAMVHGGEHVIPAGGSGLSGLSLEVTLMSSIDPAEFGMIGTTAAGRRLFNRYLREADIRVRPNA